jgi:hypothetical protein
VADHDDRAQNSMSASAEPPASSGTASASASVRIPLRMKPLLIASHDTALGRGFLRFGSLSRPSGGRNRLRAKPDLPSRFKAIRPFGLA